MMDRSRSPEQGRLLHVARQREVRRPVSRRPDRFELKSFRYAGRLQDARVGLVEGEVVAEADMAAMVRDR